MEFDWDDGNRDKNLKHGVHDWEIEEAFGDRRRISLGTTRIEGEMRGVVLGRSMTSGKYLRIVYTIRRRANLILIRPISAFEMSQSERARYLRR